MSQETEGALERRVVQAAETALSEDRVRKRYERQGILVEEAALERAEAECLADEAAREQRRLRAAGRRSRRTRTSGRAWPSRSGGSSPAAHPRGRTAAGQALDPQMVPTLDPRMPVCTIRSPSSLLVAIGPPPPPRAVTVSRIMHGQPAAVATAGGRRR